MAKIGMRTVIAIALLSGPAAWLVALIFVSLALASPLGDSCRKEICESAVVDCMREEPSRNPTATRVERKVYCNQFFDDCMRRTIAADLPWYSPQTVARFLQCPP
jgi:hypothetical protein